MKRAIILMLVLLCGCGEKCTQESPCHDFIDTETGTSHSHFRVVKRKDDRLDKMCKGSKFAMCLFSDDEDGYSGHKRDFNGCGCGDTKAQATAMCLTGLGNAGFFVDFDILYDGHNWNLSDGEREILWNKMGDYKGVEYK